LDAERKDNDRRGTETPLTFILSPKGRGDRLDNGAVGRLAPNRESLVKTG
jgi:hypothetical protein